MWVFTNMLDIICRETFKIYTVKIRKVALKQFRINLYT